MRKVKEEEKKQGRKIKESIEAWVVYDNNDYIWGAGKTKREAAKDALYWLNQDEGNYTLRTLASDDNFNLALSIVNTNSLEDIDGMNTSFNPIDELSPLEFYNSVMSESKKGKQENEVIEIKDDVKVSEDTILEKGDRIEILDKEKVEEQKLKESDDYYANYAVLLPFDDFVTSAYAKGGIEYLASDMQELFDEIIDNNQGNKVTALFEDLKSTLNKWK